jgi:DNA-directed RNA polymerase subunit beta
MPETTTQISFAKLEQGMEMPHLLDIQTRAFESLLQLDAAAHDREDVGLERVFKDLFPITDVHENFSGVRPLLARRAEVHRRGVHRT